MNLAVRAGPGDLDVLSRVIAEAFFDLPPSRWLVPDPDARREMFPAYFGLHLEQGLAHGVVWTTADRAAVALWLPAGAEPVPQAADYGPRLAVITGSRVRRFLQFDAVLERNHPGGVFHHHLALLAVRPDRQARRLGTALLGAHHRELDQGAGIPAYLEASSQRSRRLYERHGYALRAEGPFALPAGGPLLWPMWRDPRPAGDARLAGTGGSRLASSAETPRRVHIIHGWWLMFTQFTTGDRPGGGSGLIDLAGRRSGLGRQLRC